MPKIERNIEPGSIHHVYNRSVEKRTIFFIDRDYQWFLEKIAFYKVKYKVKILAFALLPNHWHLLVQEQEVVQPPALATPGVVRMIGDLCNAYVKRFNIAHDRSGPLFQGRFKSKVVEDEHYLQNLINYINLNPVKHKIVKNIKDWDYTSHWHYLEKGKFALVDKSEFIDFAVYKAGVVDYLRKFENIEEEF
ncbi:MAG: transposase [Candidatus Komeilibacteria bacterium]